MTTPVRILQWNLSQNAHTGALLRNGSVVAARVVSQNQNGSYTVSLAGQMIEVKSEAKLTAGQNFLAKVKILGNQIALSLVSEPKNPGEFVQKLSVQNQNLSPELQNFLTSLGFEPNTDSLKILQFMQQIGVKINVEQAKRALNLSKKNGKVNQEKANLSFLFEEKGIEKGELKIEKKEGNSQINTDFHRLEKRKEKSEDGEESSSLNKKSSGENSAVFSVNSVRSFFGELEEAASSHDFGALTAFNTILSKNKENPPLNHWIVLPFEWTFKNYYGNFRLLFDSELKNLQKTIIELKNSSNQHKFLLSFEKNQLSSVKFASNLTKFSSEKAESFLQTLIFSNFNRKIKVERVDFDSLSGFCCDDESFSLVKGAV